MLGAMLSSAGGWSGADGTGNGLLRAGDASKHRIVVFYHVYVANNWQARLVQASAPHVLMRTPSPARLLMTVVLAPASWRGCAPCTRLLSSFRALANVGGFCRACSLL